MRKLMFAAFAAVVALGLFACDNYDAPTSLRNTFSKQYPTILGNFWGRIKGAK